MMVERNEGFSTPLDWTSDASDIDEDFKLATSDIFAIERPVLEDKIDEDENQPELHHDHHQQQQQQQHQHHLNSLTDNACEVVTDGSAIRKRRVEFEGKAGGTRRKKKAAGLPKRPLSAYNIFFQEERLKLQESCSDMGFEDFGKIIGKHWKELSSEDRQKYIDKAMEDSVRYRNEMDAYRSYCTSKHASNIVGDEESKTESVAKTVHPKQTWSPLNSLSSPPDTLRSPPQGQGPAKARLPATYSFPPGQHYPPMTIAHQTPPTPPSHTSHRTPLPPHYQTGYGNGAAHGCHSNGPPGGNPPPSTAVVGAATVPHPPLHAPPMYGRDHAPNHHPHHPCFVASGSDSFAIPPGMEIFLPDAAGRERRYTVSYKVFSMPRDAAERYVESLATPSTTAAAGATPSSSSTTTGVAITTTTKTPPASSITPSIPYAKSHPSSGVHGLTVAMEQNGQVRPRMESAPLATDRMKPVLSRSVTDTAPPHTSMPRPPPLHSYHQYPSSHGGNPSDQSRYPPPHYWK